MMSRINLSNIYKVLLFDKKMKKGKLFACLLLAGIFTFLTLISLTSAIVCSSPNQTILTLYSQTNSHAAVFNATYNDINYGIPICFDNVFGVIYTGSNNPWQCNGANKVLGLSSASNAHAQNPALSTYLTNVCYGNLNCTIATTCPVGYNFTLSLSGLTNAHLAADSSYANKLCCSLGTTPVAPLTPGIDSAIWTDAAGTSITQAPLSQTVKMIAGTRLLDGKIINFTIYNSDSGVVLNRISSIVSGNVATITDTVSKLVLGGVGVGINISFTATYYNLTSGAVISQNSGNLLITNVVIPAGYPKCEESLNRWYLTSDLFNSTKDRNNLCLVDGVADSIKNYSATNNDCCGFGFMCTNQTDDYNGPEYKCANCTTTYLSENGRLNNIDLCNDYNKLVNANVTKEALCKADCAKAFEHETFPDGATGKKCEWINGRCDKYYVPSSGTPNIDANNGCFQTTTSEGVCTDATGTRLITYINNKTLISNGGLTIQIVPENADECADGSVEIPCRRSVISLPFFGYTQLIITLAIIAILYVIIMKSGWLGKQKNKRK